MAVALALAGCSDDSDPVTVTDDGTNARDPASLAGTLWALTSRGEGAASVATVPGTSPTIQFLPGGRFTADTGCNILNGAYGSARDKLTLESGAMTERACLDQAAQDQEAAITQAFAAVRIGERVDESLLMKADSGAVLLTYASIPTELEGTSWRVTGVNTGTSAVETSALTEALTLELGTDGTASGNAGCNRFTGTYLADGNKVTFDALATTKMSCEPDVMAVEQQYLAALDNVVAFRRSGTSVDLLDESGATQVGLAPAV
ncbi:MAG TPA: META domain-containing protein [Microthrixaceae bacterium]|nr:META domain-containing protein [Microthrixaceae bacterium]